MSAKSMMLSQSAIEHTVALSAHRLPSTRPLDHRWDRSRGIVFAAVKRAEMIERTWSADKGIRFSCAANQQANYATRTFQNTASSLPLGRRVHGVDSAGDLGMDVTSSFAARSEVDALRRKAVAKATALETMNKEQDVKMRKIQTEYEAFRKTYFDLQEGYANLQQSHSDLQSAYEDAQRVSSRSEFEALTQAHIEHTKLYNEHQREHDRLQSVHTELQAAHARLLQSHIELKTAYEDARQAGIAEGVASNTMATADSMQQLADAAKEAKLRAKYSEQKTLQAFRKMSHFDSKLAAIQLEHRRDLSTKEQTYHAQLEAQKQKSIHEAQQLEAKIISLEEACSQLSREWQDRTGRQAGDRKTYGAYQRLFDDFRDSQVVLQQVIARVGNAVQADLDAWQNLGKTMLGGPRLRILGSSYATIDHKLVTYTQENVRLMEQDIQIVNKILIDFRSLCNAFQAVMHYSRRLTKFNRFDVIQPARTAFSLSMMQAQLLAYLQHTDQLFAQEDEQRRRARLTSTEMNKPFRGGATGPRASQSLVRLKTLVNAFSELRVIESLKSQDVIEKEFYMRSLETDDSALSAQEPDSNEASTHSSDFTNRSLVPTTLSERSSNRDVQTLKSAYMQTLLGLIILQKECGVLEDAEVARTFETALHNARSSFDKQCSDTKIVKTSSRVRPMVADASFTRRAAKYSAIPLPKTIDAEDSNQPIDSITDNDANSTQQRAGIAGSNWGDDGVSGVPTLSSDNTFRLKRKIQRKLKELKQRRAQTNHKQTISAPTVVARRGSSESGIVIKTNAMQVRHFSTSVARSLGPAGYILEDVTIDGSAIANGCWLSQSDGNSSLNARTTLICKSDSERYVPRLIPIVSLFASEGLRNDSRAVDSQLSSPPSAEDTMADIKPSTSSSETSADTLVPEDKIAETESCAYQIRGNIRIDNYQDSEHFWSHRLYRNADNKPPQVYYCTSFAKSEEAAAHFLNEPLLGFDIEWEVSSRSLSPKARVSLIQIACEDKIGLFHIALFAGDTVEDLMPPTLKQILVDDAVTKAGVNIAGDATRLSTALDTDMQGIFELSHLYKVVRFSERDPSLVDFKPCRLATQVKDILKMELRKDEVRISQWTRRLDGKQTEYAASDAYAGYQLFRHLDRQRLNMSPCPPRPAFYETRQPIILGDGTQIFRASERKAVKITTATRGDMSVEDDVFFDAVESLDLVEEGYQTTQITNDIVPETIANESVSAADIWLTAWRIENPTHKVGTSTLRAYYLWHFQGMEIDDIARICSTKPIASRTVANYILNMVSSAAVPFDRDNACEVLQLLPHAVHRRYRKVLG